jgi:cation:H+ antiporter
MLFTGMLYYMLINDKVLSRLEGSVLVLMLIGFTFYLVKFSNKHVELDDIESSKINVSYLKIVSFLIVGGASLYFGSEFLVNGSIAVAKGYGVSEAVIGVSLIAVGTSIPELAASVIAALKKEKAISLGNLIGSNIFNIGSVLGLTSIVKPIEINDDLILNRDIIWVIIFSALTLILAFFPKRNKLGVFKGSFLILLYTYFIYSILK